MPLVHVLMEIERTGVLLDLEFLRRMSGDLSRRLAELETQIQAHVGAPINIASPQQFADALFKRLGLSTRPGYPRLAPGRFRRRLASSIRCATRTRWCR